jgi:hypothetical protein
MPTISLDGATITVRRADPTRLQATDTGAARRDGHPAPGRADNVRTDDGSRAEWSSPVKAPIEKVATMITA